MTAALLLAALLLAPPVPSPAPVAVASYQVGPGDVLEVAVFGQPDLSRGATVQPDGTIFLPWLRDVAVVGLTVQEVERKLTSLLAEDYMVDPHVEVKVREYNSQFVTVLGAVNIPGRKVVRGRMRLIDILIDAGGFTPRASGEVTITRTEGSFDAGIKTLTLRFRKEGLDPLASVGLELPVRNGDVITAAQQSYVTVEGEVNRPGKIPMEPDFTLSQAIDAAGGLTRFGKKNVKITRVVPGKPQPLELTADLGDIQKGKKKDLPLEPNDRITVKRKLF